MASQQPDKADDKADMTLNEHVDLSNDQMAGHLADQEDHETGVMESFRKYPWACIWCIYALWSVILISFDSQAAAAVVGIPQFRKDFGYAYGDDYVLPAAWQSAFNGAPIAV